MKKTSYEHQKVIDFVNSFKEANKNTVRKIRKYDTKLITWTLETVKIDENASKFSKDIAKKKKQQREKENRKKAANTKPIVKETAKKMPQKPRSPMRLNVVKLREEGKSFKEIGDMYNVSENSARTSYHRETHEK